MHVFLHLQADCEVTARIPYKASSNPEKEYPVPQGSINTPDVTQAGAFFGLDQNRKVAMAQPAQPGVLQSPKSTDHAVAVVLTPSDNSNPPPVKVSAADDSQPATISDVHPSGGFGSPFHPSGQHYDISLPDHKTHQSNQPTTQDVTSGSTGSGPEHQVLKEANSSFWSCAPEGPMPADLVEDELAATQLVVDPPTEMGMLVSDKPQYTSAAAQGADAAQSEIEAEPEGQVANAGGQLLGMASCDVQDLAATPDMLTAAKSTGRKVVPYMKSMAARATAYGLVLLSSWGLALTQLVQQGLADSEAVVPCTTTATTGVSAVEETAKTEPAAVSATAQAASSLGSPGTLSDFWAYHKDVHTADQVAESVAAAAPQPATHNSTSPMNAPLLQATDAFAAGTTGSSGGTSHEAVSACAAAADKEVQKAEKPPQQAVHVSDICFARDQAKHSDTVRPSACSFMFATPASPPVKHPVFLGQTLTNDSTDEASPPQQSTAPAQSTGKQSVDQKHSPAADSSAITELISSKPAATIPEVPLGTQQGVRKPNASPASEIENPHAVLARSDQEPQPPVCVHAGMQLVQQCHTQGSTTTRPTKPWVSPFAQTADVACAKPKKGAAQVRRSSSWVSPFAQASAAPADMTDDTVSDVLHVGELNEEQLALQASLQGLFGRRSSSAGLY
eukprot:jgi/Chrzof1/5094/Cz15g11070.t1